MKELTTDHFTPRCIAKELGWSREQTNSFANLQRLSVAEHRIKDWSTPAELDCVKTRGGAKTLFEHHNEQILHERTMAKKGILYVA